MRKDQKDMNELKLHEEWREYDFAGRVYKIYNPTVVRTHEGGGTIEFVTDSNGVVHYVPSPGVYDCVLRVKGPRGGTVNG
jgi:hypothetical protein